MQSLRVSHMVFPEAKGLKIVFVGELPVALQQHFRREQNSVKLKMLRDY